MDQQACLQRIGDLAAAAWRLRDHLLQTGELSPEVVRLEDAAHLLERSVEQLAAALKLDLPAGFLPTTPTRGRT